MSSFETTQIYSGFHCSSSSFCGEKIGTGTDFSLNTLVCPCQV